MGHPASAGPQPGAVRAPTRPHLRTCYYYYYYYYYHHHHYHHYYYYHHHYSYYYCTFR